MNALYRLNIQTPLWEPVVDWHEHHYDSQSHKTFFNLRFYYCQLHSDKQNQIEQ